MKNRLSASRLLVKSGGRDGAGAADGRARAPLVIGGAALHAARRSPGPAQTSFAIASVALRPEPVSSTTIGASGGSGVRSRWAMQAAAEIALVGST